MNQDRIGIFIKKIRTDNNLTQKEFADMLGVTYQAVSKWENGKNVPDIGTMKLISEKFNVNVDEILNGEKEKKTNNYIVKIVPIVFLFISILIIELILHNTNNIKFKIMSSNCSDFKVTGIAAYNKEKASISITSVEFCGKEDKEEYKEIKCKLYEVEDKLKNEISQCKNGSNTTLEDYLKTVNISVNNYSTVCKNKQPTTLLIEIEALDSNNKKITYTVPIKLNDDCK